VYELFQDADVHYSTTFKPVEYFLAVAWWYLVLTGVWTLVQSWIERRLTVSDRTDEASFLERLGAAWSPVHGWARGAR
jgi:ABC-type arginine transport system permease subunit